MHLAVDKKCGAKERRENNELLKTLKDSTKKQKNKDTLRQLLRSFPQAGANHLEGIHMNVLEGCPWPSRRVSFKYVHANTLQILLIDKN